MSERDASASIAMTASGCTARTVPRSVSIASMPVRPKTPGVSTLTEQNAENAPFCRRWRVTSTCSALLGPMASGVIFALPSPATVSYTHLDVYKRQASYCPRGMDSSPPR